MGKPQIRRLHLYLERQGCNGSGATLKFEIRAEDWKLGSPSCSIVWSMTVQTVPLSPVNSSTVSRQERGILHSTLSLLDM